VSSLFGCNWSSEPVAEADNSVCSEFGDTVKNQKDHGLDGSNGIKVPDVEDGSGMTADVATLALQVQIHSQIRGLEQ
jgi:hypothetical protein